MTIRYLLGVGSSGPQALSYIQRAYSMFAKDRMIQGLGSSRICQGAGVDTPNFGIYSNAAFGFCSLIGHEALWHKCQATESRLGRMRPYHNAPRTIDLDILWASTGPYKSKTLSLPHRCLLERGFAIYPALEITRKLNWPAPQGLLDAACQTTQPNYCLIA